MNVFDFSVKDIEGKEVSLAQFKGKTLLIVNVASRCGFTPQYKGLETLYEKYRDRGFVVLGFPCNQFGAQEPGSDAEIKEFCDLTYQVKFPMFSKVDVNGPNAAPLYKYLVESIPGFLGLKGIKWNFTKFLVGPDGVPTQRYAPTDTPEKIDADVMAAVTK